MAEKTVEKQICQNCGVDVRPNTLFCYNCGSAVSPSASNGNKTTAYPTVKDKLLEEERAAESKISKDKPEKTDLKTAAALRREKAPVQKKTVEVVWEEPQSAPNVWFLAVAFLLTLFAVGIFIAMRYIQ